MRTDPPLLEENERLYALRLSERVFRNAGYACLAGIDEAGRGSLAGPVVAAACMIPESLLIPGINDSKKLPRQERRRLFEILTTHSEICFGVGCVSALEVDRINVLQATIVAMKQAAAALAHTPDFLLIDGLELINYSIPNAKVVQGDRLCYLIAAASIIAKETRDQMMEKYHQKWPQYGFDRHKGYGTRQHICALGTYGPCPIHRLSFAPVKKLSSFTQLIGERPLCQEDNVFNPFHDFAS